MSCAELLAVCLLSAERGPAPRRQPLPIFHDVNDGKLSFEEFKNYFSDGILSSEELWEMFSGIDRRHSEGVDLSWWMLLWSNQPSCTMWRLLPTAVLSVSLEELEWRYETSSKMEQFLTRFLLRETMHQLQSLQASLECAVDTVEEQAGRERKDIKKSETSVGLRSGRRCGRRGRKNICLSPTDPYSGMLTTGTCSLGFLVSLVSLGLVSVRRDLGLESPGAVCSSSHKLHAPNLCFGSFVGRLMCLGWWGMCGCASAMPACPPPAQGHSCPHSVSACKLTDEACFILYEFWQDVTSWRSHLQSSCSKTFQQSILSLLESPELLTTMLFPGEGVLCSRC
ncbi:NECA3 protein, partial [Pachyramphus minor]|nr:NECA3 protein [Pachyramphus minor]